MLGSDAFERNDIQLKNEAGYTLECSWWKPYSPSYASRISSLPIVTSHHCRKQDVKPMPCIISLHGNSSCRLGCMDLMYHALTSGFSLFAFDFCGSGLSEVCTWMCQDHLVVRKYCRGNMYHSGTMKAEISLRWSNIFERATKLRKLFSGDEVWVLLQR